MKIGPTGRYPRGKYNPVDKGELVVSININKVKNTIEVDFGTDLSFIGLGPSEAIRLAMALLEGAAKLTEA